jgi:invasion protein IalB
MIRASGVEQPVIVLCRAAVILLLTAAPLLAQTAQPVPQTLPGGASQLQETHGDWRVTCAQQGEQRLCAMSQQNADKDSRQLVVAVELKPVSDRLEGTLILPFGLAVTRPVSLQIDEGASMLLGFRTCVPLGCVVSLKFEPATVKALRTGTLLNVKATADSAQETTFRISLKGFGSAMDRTAALSK